jgi:hypothetical protein
LELGGFPGIIIVIVPLGTYALSRTTLARKESAAAVRYTVTDGPVVWPVEQTSQYDLYSNGLRVENGLEISNQPRFYSLIRRLPHNRERSGAV